MDMVFASFVQTAVDVKFIRQVGALQVFPFLWQKERPGSFSPPSTSQDGLNGVGLAVGRRAAAALPPHRPIQKLAEAGGPHIQIICKIESQAGVRNLDSILAETDGARWGRN